jgi:CheY-like chemotaxis protein
MMGRQDRDQGELFYELNASTADGFRLSVIFVTAFDDDTRQAAIEAGCVAFLHKPFAANSLIAAIEATVG